MCFFVFQVFTNDDIPKETHFQWRFISGPIFLSQLYGFILLEFWAVLFKFLLSKKLPQHGIRQCVHMYICLYGSVQLPGTSLGSIEVSLTFFETGLNN